MCEPLDAQADLDAKHVGAEDINLCVLRMSEPPWHQLGTTGLFPSGVAITLTTIQRPRTKY